MKDHAASIPIRFVACQHVTINCLLSLADYCKLLQTQELRSITGQTEGAPAKGDDERSFVPDAQRTYLEVSTAYADQNDNEFCSNRNAHDTRDENETVDAAPAPAGGPGGPGPPEGPLGPPAKGLARHKRFTIEVVNSLID